MPAILTLVQTMVCLLKEETGCPLRTHMHTVMTLLYVFVRWIYSSKQKMANKKKNIRPFARNTLNGM